MYDHKYTTNNIPPISNVLQYHLKPHEINVVTKIINTMSLSKVKKEGFPELGAYQWAYHIVREADLLSSYDMDRAMIYDMYHSDGNVLSNYEHIIDIFENRINTYYNNNLFLTEYGKANGNKLYEKSIVQLANWKSIIQSYDRYI
jgi:hypothetical protein